MVAWLINFHIFVCCSCVVDRWYTPCLISQMIKSITKRFLILKALAQPIQFPWYLIDIYIYQIYSYIINPWADKRKDEVHRCTVFVWLQNRVKCLWIYFDRQKGPPYTINCTDLAVDRNLLLAATFWIFLGEALTLLNLFRFLWKNPILDYLLSKVYLFDSQQKDSFLYLKCKKYIWNVYLRDLKYD